MKTLKILGLSILILAIPLLAEEVKKDEPSVQNSETVGKPKAYGCFRDLKWGMTPEEAEKSLGIKLKKYPLTPKGVEAYNGEMPIGEKKYLIGLHFDSSGLSKVTIYPSIKYDISLMGHTDIDYQTAKGLLDLYREFKPALVEKFGKPTKEMEEDRGNDVDFINNLLKNKASLFTIWETDESTITLQVKNDIETAQKFKSSVVTGVLLGPNGPQKETVFFYPPLIYEKKVTKQEKKVEL
jgi:hypothetical protein